MEIKVKLNNLRIAPRKSRQVVDLVRGKTVAEARAILEFTTKRASDPILKLLNSAVASALNDFKLEESSLCISKITVDEGPKLKRSFPMSRGRAYPIIKRASHIALVLNEKTKNRDNKPIIKSKKISDNETIQKPKVKESKNKK